MAETWRAFLSAWAAYRIEAESFRVLDDGRILVVVQAFGRGRSSGLELGETNKGTRGANVFEIRDGKVTCLLAYVDSRRALADLGLAE